jgi:hypothetical protein
MVTVVAVVATAVTALVTKGAVHPQGEPALIVIVAILSQAEVASATVNVKSTIIFTIYNIKNYFFKCYMYKKTYGT